MLRVHHGTAAQIGQTFGRGWTPEKNVASLRRLHALSTEKEKLLEEKTRGGMGPGDLGDEGETVE